MQTLPLLEALHIRPRDIVAFVGAGGKTTAIWRVADELRTLHQPVIVAPTSHILEPILPDDSSLYLAAIPDPARLLDLFNQTPRVIAAIARVESVQFDTADEFPPARPIKLRGLAPDVVDQLVRQMPGPTWLIEADGARRRLLKAPAAHEPAIPASTTAVVVVAGLDAIGQALNDSSVQRPNIFATLAATTLDQPITPEAIARVLLHPHGGLKNIVHQARVEVLLTQRDRYALHPFAQATVDLLGRSGRIENLTVASLRAENPVLYHVSNRQHHVAGIVLAAGAASRFGNRAKQLLDWHGRTLVEVAVDTALAGGLEPVIVVLGAYAEHVRAKLANRSVILVENKDWAQGQSTSVKAGINALPAQADAVVFMPIDQPNLTPHIIERLIDTYASSGKLIVVASVNGKRTMPTLFQRALFAEVLTITGDRGARDVIDANPDRVVKVEIDPLAAIDIDTPEEYNRLYQSFTTGAWS